MAYTAPELLLVGAAQNLVLQTSPEVAGNKNGTDCLQFIEDPDEYSEPPTW